MPANFSPSAHSSLYIGLMSGTSMDGVDGVLADFPAEFPAIPSRTLASCSRPFSAELRAQLQALQVAGPNEVERVALAGIALAKMYALVVQDLLQQAKVSAQQVRAIGAHGQTIRHRPEMGFTCQINQPALLAELVGIDVIADLRSRDVAAGGQGAPLVPAFHQARFGSNTECRVLLNLGGIANLSILQADGQVLGFDTGPGNVLMDTWMTQVHGLSLDEGGKFAASGTVLPEMLQQMLSDPYFSLPPPKSTGRDLFDLAWLQRHLPAAAAAQDVQASLAALTVTSCAQAVRQFATKAEAMYVCGGGAFNLHIMHGLQQALPHLRVTSSAALGVPVMDVEALAFAWLAQRHCLRLPGNLVAVTGARGARVLGACYPA